MNPNKEMTALYLSEIDKYHYQKQFIVKCQVKDLSEKIKEAWNKEESKWA